MFNNDNNKLDPAAAAMYKQQIKTGALSNSRIRELLDSGKMDRCELLDEGILTQRKLDEIYYISPTEHLDNIRNRKYSNDKVRDLIKSNSIDEDDVLQTGVYTKEQLDMVLGRPRPPITVNWEDIDWSHVPSIKNDRVDVYVLGMAGSGKSVFMSGLLYYAKKKGRLITDIDNPAGSKYADILTTAVRKGQVPPPTPVEIIQYMACDFRDWNNIPHPLTFLEMSGEIFEKLYSAKPENIHSRLKEYIGSSNQKIIFFAIDYFLHSEDGQMYEDTATQSDRFEHVLKFFRKTGMLNNTEAVCFLITKWDLSGQGDNQAAAREFLQNEYLNLINLAKELKQEFGFKLEVYTFSLGNFNGMNGYTYVDNDSEKIFNWLCSFAPIIPGQKKKKWLF